MIRHATRTIGPLHFEDIEPHRFEDLIRQLAYDFRPWRYLEPTGRLGSDGGVDIRGVEMITVKDESEVVSPDDDDLSVSGSTAETVIDERIWRIQCKREKEIGPTKMRKIVAELIPDPDHAPYGVIMAAACDVSEKTMTAFREESRARGAREVHLWAKATIEDLLFLPENEHLLFIYFGISLGIRRRSGLQRIRERLALKRKLLKALKVSSLEGLSYETVLIRDIDDEAYPYKGKVPNYATLPFPPWHVVEFAAFSQEGIWLRRASWDAWIKHDGSWDLIEESKEVTTGIFRGVDTDEEDSEAEIDNEKWRLRRDMLNVIPSPERGVVDEWWHMSFGAILEVDPIGEAMHRVPHIFCRYVGEFGPYDGEHRLFSRTGHDWLDTDNRRPLFADVELPRNSVEAKPE